MKVETLKSALQNNDIEKAINSIEQIGISKSKEAIPFLIEQLKETNNHLLRNAIAIALRDIGSQEAVEPIVEMLNHPKTLGYRGTLLYALEPLEYSAHIEQLVEFIMYGNFEVSRQSLLLIESINKYIPDEVLQKCILNVKKEIEELEDKHDFLLESLNVITKLKMNNGDCE